jgi:hypothetical protein
LNMKLSIHAPLVCVALSLAVVIGCQSAEDAVPSSGVTAVLPESAEPTVPVNPDESPEEAGQAAPQVASAEEEFTPPFPDRVDFFVAPRRARAAQRGDEVVELRGFITPPDDQGTRVLLAINGTESPIAAGEEKMGVKVISIEQPKVVLQRGRNRWTETLE